MITRLLDGLSLSRFRRYICGVPLSWNEIKSRALAFSKEWADEKSERAEAKSFWDGFFNIFGVTRRRVASFEKPIKKSDGKGGFIDLLWKGMLLVEHKSKGKDLDRAFRQAVDYFPGLKERDLPRYVLVSDFERFKLSDLDEDKFYEFKLEELHDNVNLFAFIAGYDTRSYGDQDPANIKAAETLGKLHDQLETVGYKGHPLELMLVRLLFCLFAEDTAIFSRRRQFQEYLEARTTEDGSDLGMHLAHIFQVLNQPENKRQKNLDEQLAEFPYVNGKLFDEALPLASFDREMRETLLDCCGLNWSRISPAIFGSLFQSIMNKEERRALGAHYTTEANIMKVLDTLMLDDLRAEFEKAKGSKGKLEQLLVKLSEIRVLDPACGCGNFLVIAYREIRRIEIDALKALMKGGQLELDATRLIRVNVDQFFGIEIEEFPAQIAQVALWLTDHQENLRASAEFGKYYARLPLATAPNILNANALVLDWKSVVAPDKLSFIVGNPPFIGKKEQTRAQKEDMKRVFPRLKGVGKLDYVSCWFMKAALYAAENDTVSIAFVSTNSITQGEQVGILWGEMFKLGIRINFAHRTFQWSSEAKGKAAVHCVIIGFGYRGRTPKFLFEYDTPKGEPHSRKAGNINAYLVDGPNVLLHDRATPIGNGPRVTYGSFALDDGQYTLKPQDRDDLLATCPAARKFIKPFVGGEELIHSKQRFCLWLVDATPNDLKSMPEVAARVAHVRQWRAKRDRPETKALAATPTLFAEMRQPVTKYLAFPTLSSEHRAYIPIGFLEPSVIASNQVYVFEGATLYHFGVLTSDAHMTWVRAVCGRLESRYRYSAGIVYNNFPWPEPNEKQRATIEAKAQAVLDARAHHPRTSLAQLYNGITMPPNLVKAHRELDKAVYAAYGIPTQKTEAERAAALFELYEKLVAPASNASKSSAKKSKARKPR